MTSLARSNLAYAVVYRKTSTNTDRPRGTWLDLSRFEPLAADPIQLVGALNTLLLHGTMTAEMFTIITASVSRIPASDRAGRVRDAAYLIVTSPHYLVQR